MESRVNPGFFLPVKIQIAKDDLKNTTLVCAFFTMIDNRPTILTDRLCLRPFSLSDAATVQQLAGDKRISATTLNLPYPYPDGLAADWIHSHVENFHLQRSLVLAICLRSDGQLAGAIGLTLKRELDNAELGYWLGVKFWNNGYATEAAYAIVNYGFAHLKLHKIFAHYFAGNDSSGRVMQKIGMKHEGYMREHVKHHGLYINLQLYGLLYQDLVQPPLTNIEIHHQIK